MKTSGFLALLSVCALSAFCRAEEPSAAGIQFFESKIRPVLVERCYKCHSAESEKLKGGLRVDTRDALLKGGTTGPAVVPGDLEKSLLVKAIRYTDDEMLMPPKGKLPPGQVADFEAWVKMGAPDPRTGPGAPIAEKPKPAINYDEARKLWQFQPPQDHPIPKVANEAWAKSPIDKFILAKLEEKKIPPAAPADKRTLIRRATVDLTGLQPTPEEISAFLADTSPDAFAKVVDRLLASPRYGERWGRHWLDVVRYADSRDARGVGGLADIGEAWRYRDWIVDAFNKDMPYDQFVINQIAGDLLPPKVPGQLNTEGLVATGLLTIGEWGAGDADKEKMMTDIVDDQIDVVSRGFMGLTMACARCHDHKFDPIATTDYYAMAGIFFSTHILPDPGKKTDGSPMLRTPLVPPADVEKFNQYKARVESLERQLPKATEEQYAAFTKSLISETARYMMAEWQYENRPAEEEKRTIAEFAKANNLHEFALAQWQAYLKARTPVAPPAASSVAAPTKDQKPPEATEYRLMTVPVRDAAGFTGVFSWKGTPDCPSLMLNTRAEDVTITTLKLPAKSASVHPGPNNGVAVAWKSPIAGKVSIRGGVFDADPSCGDGIEWIIDHRTYAGLKEIAAGAFDNGGRQKFEETGGTALTSLEVRAGESIELLVLPKKDYTCDTTVIELTITREDGTEWNLTRDIMNDLLQGNPHSDGMGHPAVWHFYDMADSKRSLAPKAPLKNNASMQAWFSAIAAHADKSELEKAAREFQGTLEKAPPKSPLFEEFTGAKSPFWVNARENNKYLPAENVAQIAKLKTELDELKAHPPAEIPLAIAAQEGGVPQSPHAGIHDAHVHIRGSYTKLGDVVPRRFPKILAGDVQPPVGDLKTSGRLQLAQWLVSPTHPLTARVMANRIWQYHFGEGIVRTPSNYGKLGQPPTHPELLDYLARNFIASGWSIKAMHRTIMLSAVYQQSSKPAPDALKLDADNKLFSRMNRRRAEVEVLRDSLLQVAGKLDLKTGGLADRDPLNLRRMLYLMTIRSDRSSFGPLFDASDPAAQIDKRTISTVAPQSLFLMNNPFILNQTAALAQRLLSMKPAAPPEKTDAARISSAYELLYGRPANDEEIGVGSEFLAHAQQAPSNAESAWREYCQILLCANEFVYVD